jgi:hypothetical protein
MIKEALMAAFMNNQNGKAAGETMEATASESPNVGKIKSDWNKFLTWMQSKNVRGKAELDKNNLGNIYFKQYVKENPDTSLNEGVIPIIRQEYIKDREKKAQDILSGKGSFKVEGVGELTGEKAKPYIDRFMSGILKNEASENPNYIGQFLTQTPFVGSEMDYYVDDKKVKTESEGFLPSKEWSSQSIKESDKQKSTKVAKIPAKNTPIANIKKQ